MRDRCCWPVARCYTSLSLFISIFLSLILSPLFLSLSIYLSWPLYLFLAFFLSSLPLYLSHCMPPLSLTLSLPLSRSLYPPLSHSIPLSQVVLDAIFTLVILSVFSLAHPSPSLSYSPISLLSSITRPYHFILLSCSFLNTSLLNYTSIPLHPSLLFLLEYFSPQLHVHTASSFSPVPSWILLSSITRPYHFILLSCSFLNTSLLNYTSIPLHPSLLFLLEYFSPQLHVHTTSSFSPVPSWILLSSITRPYHFILLSCSFLNTSLLNYTSIPLHPSLLFLLEYFSPQLHVHTTSSFSPVPSWILLSSITRPYHFILLSCSFLNTSLLNYTSIPLPPSLLFLLEYFSPQLHVHTTSSFSPVLSWILLSSITRPYHFILLSCSFLNTSLLNYTSIPLPPSLLFLLEYFSPQLHVHTTSSFSPVPSWILLSSITRPYHFLLLSCSFLNTSLLNYTSIPLHPSLLFLLEYFSPQLHVHTASSFSPVPSWILLSSITRPYHFILLSCSFLNTSPTSVVPLILSFLILSNSVTPHIHLNILISATSNFFSCAFFTAHVSARVRTDPRMFLNVLEFEYFI